MITTSADKIIDLVMRDYKPADSNWVGDAYDMIGEAIGFIGYHVGYIKQHEELVVRNHRAILPKKFISLYHVKYEGFRLPLGADRSDIQIGETSEDTMSVDVERLAYIEKLVARVQAAEALKIGATVERLLELEEIIADLNKEIAQEASALRVHSSDPFTGNYYMLDESGNITTSFASGDIEIYGLAFPVDDRGIPIVVGTAKYKAACQYYVMMKLEEQGYRQGTWSIKDLVDLWETYRHKASNEFKMLNIDKHDRFAKMWTRFKMDPYWADTFFKGLEQ